MKYIELNIDNQKVELTNAEALPMSFNYSLEDSDNFEQKKGSESFDITVPATLKNDKIFNTFHNSSIEDLTAGQIFRSHRSCSILGNGEELLIGKCFLTEATHTNRPTNYKINCYGGNSDWIIDLKETTLYDILKNISFGWTISNIEASQSFDGLNESLPYVFAPAKYGNWLDDILQNDDNITVGSMKPALSLYWILFKGFKSIGYRIQSNFLDTNFFRRLVLPWVWGNFLSSEGTKYEIHKFRAKSTVGYSQSGSMTTAQFINVDVSNDSTDGMFDNNDTIPGGDYTWLPANQYEMQWRYNAPDYGILEATFSVDVDVSLKVADNSNGDVWVYWFKNGVQVSIEHIAHAQAPYVSLAGDTTDIGVKTSFFTQTVSAGDTISCRIRGRRFESKYGHSHMDVSIAQFQLDYFRIPLGGTISFDSYNGFKKWKFLDLVRGFFDSFNISVATDNVNKVIYLETTHKNQYCEGYFNGDFLNWEGKQDISKESTLELFSDYERELNFKFKDDSNDGIFKLIQDRNANVLAAGKYVFPDRFKTGNRNFENRFFSSTMHYEANQFKAITGVSPQLIVLCPENISNTSRSEAQNTFAPKLCWYKGNIEGVGGWKFEGVTKTSLPFMFAVNYKTGGENDPVLSYSDEKIGSVTGAEVLGVGLLKRYFWQRLAIMRNGQFYTSNFKLNNNDAARTAHREHKILQGQKWELVSITDYKPQQFQTTKCFLRKHSPIIIDDLLATFPTQSSVLTGVLNSSIYDTKYAQLKCLVSDIPTPDTTNGK